MADRLKNTDLQKIISFITEKHMSINTCTLILFFVLFRFEISLIQIQPLHDFDIRQIKMEDLETGIVHRVLHLNFTTWPDHGTPESAIPLLQVIHCCPYLLGILIHNFRAFIFLWRSSFRAYTFHIIAVSQAQPQCDW